MDSRNYSYLHLNKCTNKMRCYQLNQVGHLGQRMLMNLLKVLKHDYPAVKPEGVKHVDAPKIVKLVFNNASVYVNSCVPELYVTTKLIWAAANKICWFSCYRSRCCNNARCWLKWISNIPIVYILNVSNINYNSNWCFLCIWCFNTLPMLFGIKIELYPSG